jgi:hypothetical protein
MLGLWVIHFKNIEKTMDAISLCQVQAFSEIYLTPNYGVANLFKMLTYSHVLQELGCGYPLRIKWNAEKSCRFVNYMRLLNNLNYAIK